MIKRGDMYSFQLQSGITRSGKVVRVDKKSITVLYKTDSGLRTRTIKKGDLECQKKNKKLINY